MMASEDWRLRRELQDLAWDVHQEFDFPYPVVPRVVSQERFEELLRRERLLARDIVEQGIPA